MRPPHQVEGPCTDSWSCSVKHSGVSSTEPNMASGDSSATALSTAVQHRTSLILRRHWTRLMLTTAQRGMAAWQILLISVHSRNASCMPKDCCCTQALQACQTGLKGNPDL